MQHIDVADYLVIGAFAIAFFGLLAWVMIYAFSTRGDWRLTREGRHLMAFRTSLVLFMAMGVANNIWTIYPGRDEVRVTVVSIFAVSVVDGLRVLIIAQRIRRHQRRVDSLVKLSRGLANERGGLEDPTDDVLRP